MTGYVKRVAYMKHGRTMQLDPRKWGSVGGDQDVWRLLHRLATRHPDVEWLLVGRNTGEDPRQVGLPANVTQVWTQEVYQRWLDGAGRRRNPMTSEDRNRVIKTLDELIVPVIAGCDEVLAWCGQSGTTHSPQPKLNQTWESGNLVKPHDWAVLYGTYTTRGISVWRNPDPLVREETWLCPDPRNYVRAVDLKWPLRHPVLAQFDDSRDTRHQRYRDPRSPAECGFLAKTKVTHWLASSRYVYSGLELSMLPEPYEITCNVQPGAVPFGMIINENRRDGIKIARLDILRRWVMPYWPDCEIRGHWSESSLGKLDRRIEPLPVRDMWPVLHRYRSTFTTPASGSGWATGKPWEAFAAGVVCFFHPMYDTQGHIVPTLAQVDAGLVPDDELVHLAQWLRVRYPEDLYKRVEHVAHDDHVWRWLVGAQRKLFERRFAERRIETMIDDRLGLHPEEKRP